MDPAKLKVVELRAELQSRGLDTKGNKSVLVNRLKKVLEAETKEEIPDTSIADTSTEDFNSSQDIEEKPTAEKHKDRSPSPAKDPTPEVESIQDEPAQEKPTQEEPKLEEPSLEEPTLKEPTKKEPTQEEPKEVELAEEEPTDKAANPMETAEIEDDVPESSEEALDKQSVDSDDPEPESEAIDTKSEKVADSPSDQNGEGTNGESIEEEQKNRKSRWGNSEEGNEESLSEKMEVQDNEVQAEKIPVITDGEHQPRGEKRKNSSMSPDRHQQRRRSRSPIKEDEPEIDSSNVQLSWYDSDLHLQIDKDTFLSGKPLHEGAFSYVWAGARLSHGIKTGKVSYQVKITEECKFEDILAIPTRDRKEQRWSKKDKGKDRNKSRSENNVEITKTEETSDGTKKRDESKIDDDETAEEKVEDITDEPKETMDVEDKDEEKPVKTEDGIEMETNDDETKIESNEDDKKLESNEDDKKLEDDENIESKANEEDKVESNVDDEKVDSKEDEKKVESNDDDEDDEKKLDSNEDDKKKAEEKEQEVKQEEESHNITPYLVRIGWSLEESSLQLGETEYSYGLESTGKFFINKDVIESEAKFSIGDVITSYLDMDDETITFSYAINGEIKFTHVVNKSEIEKEDVVLFPHILTKNLVFELNVGNLEEPWFAHPEDFKDFTFISKVEDKINGPQGPTERSQCEVIMMCGLPRSGKTHWVKEHLAKSDDKKYNIIGQSDLLERMTVDAKPIEEKVNKVKMNVVIDKVTKSLNKLCQLAALRRRNFILDQTNVFPSAQRRKMCSFGGFKRRAVIVVNEDEEQARRSKQMESQTGKDIAESAVLEMKASMSIPRTGEWLDEVIFASLDESEAKAQVQKYNTQGREAGFGNIQRRDGRDDRGYNNRWGGGGYGNNQRREHRGNYRDNRNYQSNSRYDRGNRQNWRPGGNWGRNDRRDNRSPREWRNNRGGGGGEGSDRRGGGSSHDRRNHGTASNFNRNRNQGSSGGRSNNWGNQSWSNSSQGNWGGNQGGGQSQGGWTGQGWNQNQGSWNQNQWKYGGYGQGGYSQYANWNYYGQYAQNWNSQGQAGQTPSVTSGATATNSTDANQQYSQMTPQQQQAAWAQYAQQYAQNTSTAPAQK